MFRAVAYARLPSSRYLGGMRRALLFSGWLVAIGLSCVLVMSAPAQRGNPVGGFSGGVDVSALETLYSEMEREEHHDLKGIVVVRDGHVVSERYFNGDSAGTLHDIRSATKSITSLLMGFAVQKGIVHSVRDSIAMYLPGLPKDGREKITVEDLLTMRSGLDADDTEASSPGNEDRLDESSDWIRAAYAVPMKRSPGEKYLYCSLNAFLAGAIVENASHMPLDEFAKANLFGPLGITKFHWRHVPVNRTTGQGNLEITARDAASIGELMLNDGVVKGRRLLSHDWIARSLASEVAISDSDPYADAYGWMWYTRAEPVGTRMVEVHFASGNGGNKIYVVPSLHMVVAITSSAYGHGYGQRRSQEILLRVLAATREGPAAVAK
jgi:CubicO group peptidase (beta-lactamase class C family)